MSTAAPRRRSRYLTRAGCWLAVCMAKKQCSETPANLPRSQILSVYQTETHAKQKNMAGGHAHRAAPFWMMVHIHVPWRQQSTSQDRNKQIQNLRNLWNHITLHAVQIFSTAASACACMLVTQHSASTCREESGRLFCRPTQALREVLSPGQLRRPQLPLARRSHDSCSL